MIKATFLFQQGTTEGGGGRIAGWSETWYNQMEMNAYNPNNSSLLAYRAQMMTDKAAIVGVRVRDSTGAVKVFKIDFQGTITTNADIPQMSLSCFTTNVNETRRKYFRLRGLPDARTTDGVYVPLAPFYKAFTDWQQRLATEQWGWMGLSLTPPQIKITAIDANGNLTCAAGGNFAVNNIVIIRRCKNDALKNVNGEYRILAYTNNQSFQLANWTGGVVGARGSVALYSPEFIGVGMDKTKFENVTTQKVGRPFNSYRGRATKR